MKKVAAWALALLALLTGCGGEAPFASEDAGTLLAEGLFIGDMEAVDASVAAMLYGVDAGTVTDCMCYMAANTSVSADEIAVLVLTDEEAARTAEAALSRYLAERLEEFRIYTPAAAPRLEAAVLRRRGNTVLLAVGDPERLEEAVDGLHRT